jgi:hypothetical protein
VVEGLIGQNAFEALAKCPIEESSIGQKSIEGELKCPIKGLYWTKHNGISMELSDRRALLDKTQRK